MRTVWNKLKKLRGRGLEELRVRGAQAASAAVERRGWSALARVPSEAEFFKLLRSDFLRQLSPSARDAEARVAARLLEHFRTRRAPAFFPPFDAPAETRAALLERFSKGEADETVARAERILAGRFDLLGFRQLDFGNPVDCHLEPLAKKRAPLAHWSRIEYLKASAVGDKKIIWELNRQQYFATLGRAYWRTGDERFAAACAAHLEGWMNANPPKLGINWASSLEVAFRAISWLWAFYFFKDSKHLSPALFLRALKFLYLHARHLETYLSTYFSPNTHLTGEALGLFYLGTLLPEFARAARWRATGERILLDQLERHVRPDGVYFEQSSYYHRYTTDFYTHYLLLARANGFAVDARLTEKLAALLDHLMFITRPDGLTPLFGDDDGGRLVLLDEREARDFRATLSTGAILFSRPDYKWVARRPSEETFWLTGPRGLDAYERLEARAPEATSRAFASGGFYVMRDSWERDANYLLLDCGPHGTLNCGHAHADALSFELAARGRALLLDPGTYTYTGDASARDAFRSTAMHNALTVDGESSSLPAGPFQWSHIARAETLRWVSRPRFDFFEGTHDGYKRLDETLDYRRAVLFLKNDYWVVRDRISGATRPHLYELNFHFAPDAAPSIETGARAGIAASGRQDMAAGRRKEMAADERTDARGLENADDGQPFVRQPFIRATGEGAAGLELFVMDAGGGRLSQRSGEVSGCYGAQEPAPVFVYTVQAASGGCDLFTFLLPRAAEDAASEPASVRALTATGGSAFDIACGREGQRDVLLARRASARETGTEDEAETVESQLAGGVPVSSDFALAWARFARGGVMPDELVLVGGRRFVFDGQELVNFAERVAFAYARREGERLTIETETTRQTVYLKTEVVGLF